MPMPDPHPHPLTPGELRSRLERQPGHDPALAPGAPMRIADGADVRLRVEGEELYGTVLELAGEAYVVALPHGRAPTVDRATLEAMNPDAPRVPG
jgi:hypothetical protein